ncbi:dual specificity protein kinase yak1 [Ancistrocladus abbreviatus]
MAYGRRQQQGEEEEEEGEEEEETSSAATEVQSASESPSYSSGDRIRRSACSAFSAYSPHHSLSTTDSTPISSFASLRKLVGRLTKDLVQTYHACNPEFKYSEELNPRRFLTSPTDGVLNDGHDNANSDLILTVNYVLVNSETQRRYIVKDILGHGTFGQVARCWVPETNSFVAVKIIKNQPAYYQQALVEVSILTTLNRKFDPEDKHHIVRIYDYFVFQRHLCISFELLDTNLYELIKINSFRGLSLSIVQLFSKQILCGLALMKDAGIIHCDLKPENILLCTSVKPVEVKIIDFGSACMEDRTVYSYIQSRYYRSPEVLLGYQYSTAIDMWSFGCIVAELFLGLPLFPGASEFDLLKRMIRILGGQPPDYILKDAKNTSKFFKCVGSVDHVDAGDRLMGARSAYQALNEEEYEAREKKKPVVGKEYFNYMNLEGIVAAYPYRKNLPEEDIVKERQIRLALIDFLKGLVEFDPAKRWSPFQASKHPFVTGEPFKCPFIPPPETPRVPVAQNFKVDHHPGGGHWFAAGLSPNVPGRNIGMHPSPHFSMVPYGHGGSYGSLGSHGSYSDCTGLGSSYGSYGDNFSTFAYFSPVGPSGMNVHSHGGLPMVGTSPDARRNMLQRPGGLGISPAAGGFAPLPLGTSPSQFTPPSSFCQISGSPGHFGPTSPVRGHSQGSPLGKGAAASHFNRRRGWGFSGIMQSQEGSSSSHRQGQFTEASWKQPQGASGFAAEYASTTTMPSSMKHGFSMQFSQTMGTGKDRLETGTSLPDPGDWDPNYSDELLLQEDSPEASCIVSQFSNELHISQASVQAETFSGFGRFKHNMNPSSSKLVQRQNGPIQTFSQLEVGSPSSVYDLRVGYGRSLVKGSLLLPQLSHNSPSRLGQQPIQRFNHGRSSAIHVNEGSHINLQPNPFSFNSGGPHSPGSSSYNNGTPWERRANYPITSMQPSSSCGRKDYNRIA